eukprot:5346637-Lingulodinium_polyedra.AAC.1
MVFAPLRVQQHCFLKGGNSASRCDLLQSNASRKDHHDVPADSRAARSQQESTSPRLLPRHAAGDPEDA